MHGQWLLCEVTYCKHITGENDCLSTRMYGWNASDSCMLQAVVFEQVHNQGRIGG